MSDGALSGIVVLDLTGNISGPCCTKLLADYGADVIKIEKPIIGDDSRRAGPFPNRTDKTRTAGEICRGRPVCLPAEGEHVGSPLHDNINPPDIEKDGLFLFLNTGKRGVTLDIEQPRGADILRRLVKHADIVVENFRPGTMERLGLGYETLTETNPALIMASISYFGQTGPCSGWSGDDLIAQATGGLMYLTGEPEREPLKLPLAQAEYQAGLNAAVALLCAVFYRDAVGEGQYIDVSVQEAVASILEGAVSTYSYSGYVMRRAGSRHQHKCPSTIMRAADGYVHIQSGAYWDHFATLFEAPQLMQPPLNSILRYHHAGEVEDAVKPWVGSRSAREVFDACCEWRLPCGMVLGVEELDGDPQFEARGFFREIDHPAAGRLKYPGAPFAMSETPAEIRRAPLHGEHNEEIYAGLLKLGRDELSELRERNVI